MPSLKNLEAALLQLQGKALEHYGAIEILINSPAGISEHTDYVSEIIKHAKALSECEEAYGTLKTHFVPKPPQAVAPPVSTPPVPQPERIDGEESVVTSKNSPTMRRAQESAKARERHEEKND